MLTAVLKVVGGSNDGRLIPLTTERFLIGREQDCQLRPNNEMVSRHHCAISVDDYTVRIRDLGSTNGTSVNGELIRGQVQLKTGDRIHVGKLVLEVIVQSQQEEVVKAPSPGNAFAEETAELATSETLMDLPVISNTDSGSFTVGDTIMNETPETTSPEFPTPQPTPPPPTVGASSIPSQEQPVSVGATPPQPTQEQPPPPTFLPQGHPIPPQQQPPVPGQPPGYPPPPPGYDPAAYGQPPIPPQYYPPQPPEELNSPSAHGTSPGQYPMPGQAYPAQVIPEQSEVAGIPSAPPMMPPPPGMPQQPAPTEPEPVEETAPTEETSVPVPPVRLPPPEQTGAGKNIVEAPQPKEPKPEGEENAPKSAELDPSNLAADIIRQFRGGR